jgi:hypothetical protein
MASDPDLNSSDDGAARNGPTRCSAGATPLSPRAMSMSTTSSAPARLSVERKSSLAASAMMPCARATAWSALVSTHHTRGSVHRGLDLGRRSDSEPGADMNRQNRHVHQPALLEDGGYPPSLCPGSLAISRRRLDQSTGTTCRPRVQIAEWLDLNGWVPPDAPPSAPLVTRSHLRVTGSGHRRRGDRHDGGRP